MKAYPYAIASLDACWAGAAMQFEAFATAATREELVVAISEQLALYLLDAGEYGFEVPEPLPRQELDLSEVADGSHEVVYIEPAVINPVSLEIARAIRSSGLTKTEVARRMGTLQSVVTHMTNPFYWGHSMSLLNRLAATLGRALDLQLGSSRKSAA